MPPWLDAGLWGLFAGSSLLIGAAAGCYLRIPQRIIAAIMAFGAGVLVSALSFDLMDEAYRHGGFLSAAAGFFAGGLVFTVANLILARHGAKHRKRSQDQQPSESAAPGSGLAIALGALLDGIPESIVIGVTSLTGGAVSIVAVAAVFLSNVPEGLSSAAGMRHAGRSLGYIFGVWIAITVVSGLAALLGNALFRGAPASIVSATTSTAAGAILAMLADTMIPEAFEHTHNMSGLITVAGFLLAFWLSKVAGG